MGFFDDIGQVEAVGAGSNRLRPGSYPHLRITGCEVIQGFHGTRFIASFDVVESSGPDATPAGSSGDWSARIDGQWDKIGKGEVKTFVAAALGVDPAAVDAKTMAEVLNGKLNGVSVQSDAFIKKTQGDNEITKHTWDRLDGSPAPAAAPPPPPAAAAAPPAPFPPAGWTAHPTAPGYFYRGQEVLSEADLRARA